MDKNTLLAIKTTLESCINLQNHIDQKEPNILWLPDVQELYRNLDWIKHKLFEMRGDK